MANADSDTFHVYDTRVNGKKGLLDFDFMTTDEATALTLAKQYLASIGRPTSRSHSGNVSSATASRS
jgi:hypothetical protein